MKKSAIYLLTLLGMLLLSIDTALAWPSFTITYSDGGQETFTSNSTSQNLSKSAGYFKIVGHDMDTNNHIEVFVSGGGGSFSINTTASEKTFYVDMGCYFIVNLMTMKPYPQYFQALYVNVTAPIPVVPTAEESESEPKPVIYPEDEFGAYYLNDAGKKEYIGYHTYEICTRFMTNADACESYLR